MRNTRIALAALALAAPALAQTPPTPARREAAAAETVSVSGVGRATLAPDRASFSVGVQSMGPSVAAAVQENNQRVAAIVAAMRKLGATRSGPRSCRSTRSRTTSPTARRGSWATRCRTT